MKINEIDKSEKSDKSDKIQPPIQEAIKKKEKSVRMVEIMFKQNRKFDLHVGREMVTFRGRETKEVPEAWIQHKDFESVKKYFVVKGE